jgi:ribosome assembly protein 3
MSEKQQDKAAFDAYYLQRATSELADDLNKVRSADDFKADSIPALVRALQQGFVQFSPSDRERILASAGSTQNGNSSA